MSAVLTSDDLAQVNTDVARLPQPARGPLKVDALHVINLDRRPERLAQFTQQVRAKAGWDVPIFRHSAVDTSQWSTAKQPLDAKMSFVPFVSEAALPIIERGWRDEETQITRGAVGCALSHIHLWNLLVSNRDWEYMAIFEDDALWMQPGAVSLPESIAAINANVPNDWDILFLGAAHLEVHKDHGFYSELRRFWCTQSYIIHRDAAAKLLHGIFPLSVSIDAVLWPKIANEKFKAYSLNNRLFFQNFSSSDIITPHRPAPVALVKEVPSAAVQKSSQQTDARRIFQTWKTRNDLPDNYTYWSRTWKDHHPDFKYELWSDTDNRAFIERYFPWFLQTYDAFPKEIYRVDAVRYFYLFKYGGIYADLDFECLNTFTNLFRDEIKPGVPMPGVFLAAMGTGDSWSDHRVPNALMVSREPRHVLWAIMIAHMMRPTRPGLGPEWVTGPVVLFNALKAYQNFSSTEALLADAEYGAILKLLSEPGKDFVRSAVVVLPENIWYPVDWTTQEGQEVRRRVVGEGHLLSDAEKKQRFPNSMAVTYWTKSWSTDP